MTRPPEGERGRSPRAEKSAAENPTPASAHNESPASSDGAELPQVSFTADDALTLPPGALVALRRSGGLLFSMREVVVYPDGRLVTSARGGGRPAQAGVVGALSAARLATLRRTLGETDLARLHAAPPVHPRPDAYAYEIVARPARLAPPLEVLDGAIPQELTSLIRLFSSLLTQVD